MKRILFMCLSISLVLTSCLKDENIENQKYGMKGIEDRPLVLFPSAKTTTTLESSNKDTSFHLVTVRLAEPNTASEDVQVTLTQNDSAVTAAGFTVAPATAYKIDNLVVTIPAGKREGYVTITTKTSSLTSATYAFGYTIAAISNPRYTISGVNRTIVAVVPVKNQYDADYDVSVELTGHPSAAGHYDEEVHFATLDGTTIDTYLAVAYIFAASSRLYVKVNPDNKLTITSNAVTIIYYGDNYYDPATKTFHFNYGWGTRKIVGTAKRK